MQAIRATRTQATIRQISTRVDASLAALLVRARTRTLTPICHGRNVRGGGKVRSSPWIAAAALASMLVGTVQAQPQQQPTPPPSAPGRATPAPAAQQPSAEASGDDQFSEAQREAARVAYARGQTLFAQEDFAAAKAAFEEAYAQVPNPIVLVSIAECEMRLGNLEAALQTFRRYLEERPDAPDRADVEQKIADIEATPSTLVLTSDPIAALIVLDGVNTGKTTPSELRVTPGEHSVELVLDGYVKAATPVTAKIGARHEVHVALEPQPPVETVAPGETGVTPTVDQTSPTTALWITGVIGAAGIITGSVLGFMVLAEQSDFDSNPTVESADRGERLALFTDVAFGVGAMALLTGAVIYLTADQSGPPESDQEAARLRVSPAFSPEGAGLVARTRF